jgi:hypothetical protein
MMTYLCFIYSRALFYFDVPHAVNVAILWTRFFIFAFGHRYRFRRGFYRQRFRRRRRGRFRFSFRLRFGKRIRHSHRSSFVFLRQSVQFSSFGDDDLRPLTGLGEDGELRGGSLFATTGHLT